MVTHHVNSVAAAAWQHMAVLVAAAVPARAGEHVLDLGSGVGAAMLCLAARVPGLVLTGVERQADYADLARRNAEDAGHEAEIAEACLTRLPPTLTARSFDHGEGFAEHGVSGFNARDLHPFVVAQQVR